MINFYFYFNSSSELFQRLTPLTETPTLYFTETLLRRNSHNQNHRTGRRNPAEPEWSEPRLGLLRMRSGGFTGPGSRAFFLFDAQTSALFIGIIQSPDSDMDTEPSSWTHIINEREQEILHSLSSLHVFS